MEGGFYFSWESGLEDVGVVECTVFRYGIGAVEGFGIGVVGAGIDGEEGPDPGAAVRLDFEGVVTVLGPEDFDLAAAGAEGDFRGEGGGIRIDGIRADDAEG